MADDMRPQLGSYGQAYMKTPHLDKLSASGLHFDFAYTNFAYCAPSRNSFMSGRRPDRTRCLNFMHTFRKAPGGEAWTAMPQFFKKHGYFTSAAGKLYHDGMDDAPSWSFPSNQTHWIKCQKGDMNYHTDANYCGVTNESKVTYTDEDLVLEEGLRRIELAHASGKPWWVGIGVHRPHWAYRVPDGFYGPQLYPPGADDVVQPPAHPQAPEGAPWMSGNWEGGDIHDPAHGCPSCIVPNLRAIEYRRWYYAAVTYSDHMLGRALAKIDELGVASNTIVVFHADHGYQLGELNEWSKKTNTELAVHIPLFIRVPWKNNSIGKRTQVKAELVDMYRTLAELTGLGGVEDGVQGTSLAEVFDNPAALQKKVAYSQIPRCGCHGGYKHNSTECGLNVCIYTGLNSTDFNFMGYSVRTDEWRYTAWVPWDRHTESVAWSAFTAKGASELFALANDTGRDFDFAGYSKNVAGEAQYAPVVTELHQMLVSAVSTWNPGAGDDKVFV